MSLLHHHHHHYVIRRRRGFPWTLATFLTLGAIGFMFEHPWLVLGTAVTGGIIYAAYNYGDRP